MKYQREKKTPTKRVRHLTSAVCNLKRKVPTTMVQVDLKRTCQFKNEIKCKMKSGSCFSFIFKLASFFLVQITQDAVLYACKFTGTVRVPGIIQGPHCHSGLWSVEATAQRSNISTTTGTRAKRLKVWHSPTFEILSSPTKASFHRQQPQHEGKWPSLHAPSGINPPANRLQEDAQTLSARIPRLRRERRPLPAVPRGGIRNWRLCTVGEDFSRVFKYFCRTHLATQRWEGAAPCRGVAAPAPPEMLAGLHPAFCVERSGLSFPGAFGELEGTGLGFKVCATSLVRQSKRLQQLSAAFGQICSGQRKPPCEMGLALLSCTSIHAVLDEFLKMLSQPPTTSNSAECFWGGVGKPQARRQTGTVGPVPWLLLYQHGCLLYLAILKRTVRLKPWFFPTAWQYAVFVWSTLKYPERICFCQISNSIFSLHITILYTFVWD